MGLNKVSKKENPQHTGETRIALFGGLGNQLFMWSAGQYLATQFGHNVSYLYLQEHIHKNRLTLQERGLNGSFSVVSRFPSNLSLGPQNFRRRARVLLPGFSRLEKKVASFRHFQIGVGEDMELAQVKRGAFLSGYWQTFRYPDALETGAITWSRLLLEPRSDRFALMMEEIERVRPLAIHVRAGDYKGSSFGVISPSYYRQCVQKMRSTGDVDDVWIFSSDFRAAIDVREALGGSARIIESHPFDDPAEDLALMSQCQRIVIANSTFSWWAGYLSGKRAEVFAPKYWSHSKDAHISLLPAHWQVVENSFQ